MHLQVGSRRTSRVQGVSNNLYWASMQKPTASTTLLNATWKESPSVFISYPPCFAIASRNTCAATPTSFLAFSAMKQARELALDLREVHRRYKVTLPVRRRIVAPCTSPVQILQNREAAPVHPAACSNAQQIQSLNAQTHFKQRAGHASVHSRRRFRP